MARPKKQGIDYFPHDVHTTDSRTLFTLESQFGNDGYAFWFKLLEIIGCQSELYYDCNNSSNWLFLLAKTRVSDVSATEILGILSQLDAIDAPLWTSKIIWVQKLPERISDVWKKRGTEMPQKPSFCDVNYIKSDVSVPKMPQSKVKESKVKESKVNNSEKNFSSFWSVYPKKISKADALKAWNKISPDEELTETIIKVLEEQKKTEQWSKNGGQFIPYPATWLNGKRWEDEQNVEIETQENETYITLDTIKNLPKDNPRTLEEIQNMSLEELL